MGQIIAAAAREEEDFENVAFYCWGYWHLQRSVVDT
jgi:hypothetical protein